MALVISCAWDQARVGTASIRWTDAAGAHGPVSFATGRSAHVSASSIARVGSGGLTYSTGISSGSFATRLAAAMDSATTETVTCSRSSTTGLYTIACTGATFSLDFATDGAAGTRMRQILGMTGDRTGALTYSSQCVPKYTIIPHRDGRTAYTGVKQKTDAVRQWTTDAGAPGSLGPTYLARMARWEHWFEPEGAVWHRLAAADTVALGQQYTWEALSEDCYQNSELVFVEDSVTPTESLAFYLTASPVGDSLRPVRPEMRRFAVPIEAAVMGILP